MTIIHWFPATTGPDRLRDVKLAFATGAIEADIHSVGSASVATFTLGSRTILAARDEYLTADEVHDLLAR